MSAVSKRVEVVQISTEELGFADGTFYADIVQAAQLVGLEPCPLELAPYLRLVYSEQTDTALLTIASVRAFTDESYPNGFYLSSKNDELWLRGYRSTSDWIWSPESSFAFVNIGV